MPARICIGMAAIDVYRSRWGAQRVFMKRGLRNLETEVRAGQCCLTVSGEGDVERVVAVAAMELHREDGLILVRLGKWENGCVAPLVDLPGTKQRQGEAAKLVLRRVFDGDLRPLWD